MKYRKKPVIIEAEQLGMKNLNEILKWMGGKNVCGSGFDDNNLPFVTIKTLEGDMCASLGDYVIRGVKGEFYPCKPDIFEMTYELVEEKGGGDE